MRASAPSTVTLTVGALLFLSGCGLWGGDEASQVPAPTPTEQSDDVDKAIESLQSLAGEEGLPKSKRLFDTLVDAGYKAEALEATMDASPLGNEVPAKIFGIKLKEGCVVGEIRDKKVTARLQREVVSTGTCLLGDIDRPEGVDAPKGEAYEEDAKDNGEGHRPDEDINAPMPGESGAPGDSGNGGSGDGDSGNEDPGSGDPGDGGSGSGPEDGGDSGLGGT